MSYLTRVMFSLILVSGVAGAGELVQEFKGTGSTDTTEFEIEAPWILDWRVSGEFTESLAVDVALLEAGTGVHVGNVLKTKRPGNGVRLFNQSGQYYFRVNSSMANWTLRVEKLTEEEAEAYTPTKPEQPF